MAIGRQRRAVGRVQFGEAAHFMKTRVRRLAQQQLARRSESTFAQRYLPRCCAKARRPRPVGGPLLPGPPVASRARARNRTKRFGRKPRKRYRLLRRYQARLSVTLEGQRAKPRLRGHIEVDRRRLRSPGRSISSTSSNPGTAAKASPVHRNKPAFDPVQNWPSDELYMELPMPFLRRTSRRKVESGRHRSGKGRLPC